MSTPHLALSTSSAGRPAADASLDLNALWANYRTTRDPIARATLITTYYPLVRHVARRIAASLSHQVEVDDLEGYGAEGLLDAVDRYDGSRGAQFATFAAHRIKGAIYDGIRSSDWAPRSVRRKEREIRANHAILCHEFGREPTEVEEAGALGIAIETLRVTKHQVSETHVTSLDQRRTTESNPSPDPVAPDDEPLEIYVANETTSTLRAGFALLDERERAVTTLSFDEGLTLAEIGARLGVTESRVCQIRAGAIKRLRAYARSQGVVQT
jgi:RNA polymerase sigma factor for flagellar operon FliA